LYPKGEVRLWLERKRVCTIKGIQVVQRLKKRKKSGLLRRGSAPPRNDDGGASLYFTFVIARSVCSEATQKSYALFFPWTLGCCSGTPEKYWISAYVEMAFESTP